MAYKELALLIKKLHISPMGSGKNTVKGHQLGYKAIAKVPRSYSECAIFTCFKRGQCQPNVYKGRQAVQTDKSCLYFLSRHYLIEKRMKGTQNE